MNRFKKQIPLFFLLLLTACLYRKEITFKQEDVYKDASFFSEIPAIAKNAGLLNDSAKQEGKIRFYKITFCERLVENGNVVDFSNISNDSIAAVFSADTGARQELYLANIPMSNNQDNLYVYYSVNYNGFGNVVGFGPAYLGQLVACPGDKTFNQIEFFAELKSNRKAPYILTRKKCDHTDLKFILAKNSCDTNITVSKIVQAAPNKIGGTNPLVFNTDSILGRNRLNFIYINK